MRSGREFPAQPIESTVRIVWGRCKPRSLWQGFISGNRSQNHNWIHMPSDACSSGFSVSGTQLTGQLGKLHIQRIQNATGPGRVIFRILCIVMHPGVVAGYRLGSQTFTLQLPFDRDCKRAAPEPLTDTASLPPAPPSMPPRPPRPVPPGRPAWLGGRPPTGATAHHH